METAQVPTVTTKPSIKDRIKTQHRVIGYVLAILIAVSAVYGYGYKSGYKSGADKLPANAQCLKAIDDTIAALQGADIKVGGSIEECRKTQGNYSVTRVEVQK